MKFSLNSKLSQFDVKFTVFITLGFPAFCRIVKFPDFYGVFNACLAWPPVYMLRFTLLIFVECYSCFPRINCFECGLYAKTRVSFIHADDVDRCFSQ